MDVRKGVNHGKKNEAAGARTLDLRIKSPLLYQLSYSLYTLQKQYLIAFSPSEHRGWTPALDSL